MDNREANYAGHPPACTCKECVNRRLSKKGIPTHTGKPESDGTIHTSNSSELKLQKSPKPKISGPPPMHRKPTHTGLSSTGIPNWLLALLLFFGLSAVGLGINAYTGSPIPLWLLLGFSLIFSTEKWFRNITFHRPIGKVYRFLLNLSILAMLGLLIWSAVQLVSKQLANTPLIGSLIFIVEFIFFVWLWRVVTRNSWRWPSMKLTVLSLICLSLVFTFAGIQPMSAYKDNLIVKYVSWQEVREEKEKARVATDVEQNESEIDYEFVDEFKILFNLYREGAGYGKLKFYQNLDEEAMRRAIALNRGEEAQSSGGFPILQLTAHIDHTTSPTELIYGWTEGFEAKMRLSEHFAGAGFSKVGGVAVLLLVR